MAKQLVHLGTTVSVSFGVLEDGNVTLPSAVDATGAEGPLKPVTITLRRLDDAAFEELKARIAEIREKFTGIFCAAASPAETSPAAPPAIPDPPAELPPATAPAENSAPAPEGEAPVP